MTPAATILIVDNESQNRKLLEAMLRPEGYNTVSISNGEDALALIAESPPDLILLDIMMPGMDGYQVAITLKANPVTSNIPIIMLTALIDRDARLTGLNAGAEEFLTKPVDRAELWLRVRNLLRLKAFGDFLQNHSTILERQVQERTADLQRFRTAMDSTSDAIFLVSRATMCFVEVNAAASNMLGYTRAELLKLGPVQLDGATREQIETIYDLIIAGHSTNELAETQLLRKDGSYIQVEVHRNAQHFGDDWIIVGVLRDITQRKEAEKRLHHLAHYDALTGLPNRILFYETLKKTLVYASENDWRVTVLFIDLDHFKNVNDTLGHASGDELLRQFSDRLVRCIRIRDTVGRMGGDEFAVILVMQEDQPDTALLVANKIREILYLPFDLNGHMVGVTASIGITIYPDDASDTETLMKYADTAMYRAKQAGRDTSRFFTAQMNIEVLARLELEMALRKAIDNNEFILYYQPKVQINTGRIIGVEALIRWMRPGFGMIPPGDFIPLLEETGLIARVGTWVIQTACKQIAAWTHKMIGPIPISVNVSGRQFAEGNLEAVVVHAIHENNIEPDFLELELTESSLMSNVEHAITILDHLKALGLQISIDDFGTGYSSLAYLKRFPIDKLKIDIAFIRDIITHPDEAAITLAIISMAHSLKLQVIAEGVETEAQLAYLRRHGCDQMQGFYFSRPVPIHELEQMLQDDKHLQVPSEGVPLQVQTLLIVDADASVLTELIRILRPDNYRILTASSANEALELLALNPVQVILCDQHTSEMGGATFLDRVKDLYPHTFRMVLAVPTDLEAILHAINRGAIHRFYTKPWENKALRANIREAFMHYWHSNGSTFEGVELVNLVDPGKEIGVEFDR